MLRVVALGLMVLSLSPVAAQTPGDIARQLWPYSLPLSSNAAPAHEFPGNQFLPPSIASRPALPIVSNSSSVPPAAVTMSFAGLDLARLRGAGSPVLFARPEPDQRMAAREPGR